MTPEPARYGKLLVKMQTLRSLPTQELPQIQKEGGHEWLAIATWNLKFGVIFAMMCTYDPMFPASTTTGPRS